MTKDRDVNLHLSPHHLAKLRTRQAVKTGERQWWNPHRKDKVEADLDKLRIFVKALRLVYPKGAQELHVLLQRLCEGYDEEFEAWGMEG